MERNKKEETRNDEQGKEQQLLIRKWNGARNVNGLVDRFQLGCKVNVDGFVRLNVNGM